MHVIWERSEFRDSYVCWEPLRWLSTPSVSPSLIPQDSWGRTWAMVHNFQIPKTLFTGIWLLLYAVICSAFTFLSSWHHFSVPCVLLVWTHPDHTVLWSSINVVAFHLPLRVCFSIFCSSHGRVWVIPTHHAIAYPSPQSLLEPLCGYHIKERN